MRNQSNPLHRENFAIMRDELAMLFPAAFAAEKGYRPALAMGVHHQLAEGLAGVYPRKKIADFLAVWCHRPRYLRAVAAGGMRFDLYGNPVAPISEGDVIHAQQSINSRRRKPVSDQPSYFQEQHA